MATGDGKVPIIYNGEPFTVTVIMADTVAWERYARSQRIPLNDKALDFPQNERTAYMLFAACKRMGRVNGTTYDEWLPGLTLDVTAMTDETESDANEDDPISGPVAQSTA